MDWPVGGFLWNTNKWLIDEDRIGQSVWTISLTPPSHTLKQITWIFMRVSLVCGVWDWTMIGLPQNLSVHICVCLYVIVVRCVLCCTKFVLCTNSAFTGIDEWPGINKRTTTEGLLMCEQVYWYFIPFHFPLQCSIFVPNQLLFFLNLERS